MKNSLLKSIRFNMDDAADKELYEWLSHLPRGNFSLWTKSYWEMHMKKAKSYEEESESE